MSAPLQIRLLGECQISRDGIPLEGIDTSRLRALIAYLVLHRGKEQQRSHLAFLFWPDSTEKQALTNLRHQLHALRRAIPGSEDFLEVEGRSLLWRSEGAFCLDVADFEMHLARADEAAQIGDRRELRNALESAIQTYAGELLPGVYEEWAESERERLAQAYAGALEKLVKLCEDLRDYEAGFEFAGMLKRHEPTRETTYAAMMRLAVLLGDRARALQAYRDCQIVLRRELNAIPSPALQAFYNQILAEKHPVLHAEPVAPQEGEELPFQGRHTEWNCLTRLWAITVRGAAHLAVITGEPGIGKSRLAEELMTWAARQGAVAARARSYLAEGRLAYAPVTTWLRSEPFRSGLERLDEVWLSELARLLPEIRSANMKIGLQGDQFHQRHRLFEALSRGVLARGGPLLLFLDDMQWTDRETLEWLRFLLRFAPTAPMLLIGTIRSEELTEGSAVERLLRELRRDEMVTEISLGPIGVEDAALVAKSVVGRSLSTGEVARLYEETGGNPLFIVETARAAMHSERDARSLWRTIPPKVHAVICARLGHLSRVARDLVAIAAVIGREFNIELLGLLCGYGEDELADGLDELWQRRFIKEENEPWRYDFSHDKLREVAYQEIPPARRRLLHRRVAEALETLHAAHLDEVSAQLALHYEEAGCMQKAVDACRRAAEAAKSVFASDEAMRLFQKAIALVPAIPENPGKTELELDLQTSLGACLVAQDGYPATGVMEIYERASELCRTLGRPISGPILRALALGALSMGQIERARRHGSDLFELYGQQGDPLLAVEGHYVLGVSDFWRADFASSRAHLEAALERFDPENRAKHIAIYAQDPCAVCMCRLAWTRLYLGFADEAARTMERALAYIDEIDHPHTEAYVLYFSAHMCIDLRDWVRLRRLLEAIETLTRKYRLTYWTHRAMIVRGVLEIESGAIEKGIAVMDRGFEIYTDLRNTLGGSQYQQWFSEAYLRNGDTGKAREALAGAFAYVERSGERHAEPELYRVKACIALAEGDDADALEYLHKSFEIAGQRGTRFQQLRAAMDLAALEDTPGARVAARERLARILGQFTEGFQCADLVEARARLQKWN